MSCNNKEEIETACTVQRRRLLLDNPNFDQYNVWKSDYPKNT